MLDYTNDEEQKRLMQSDIALPSINQLPSQLIEQQQAGQGDFLPSVLQTAGGALKTFGGALLGGIADTIYPGITDYLYYKNVMQRNPEAILDPNFAAQMYNQKFKERVESESKAKLEQLQSLANAALMAHPNDLPAIARQMDNITGRKGFFENFLIAADKEVLGEHANDEELDYLPIITKRAFAIAKSPSGKYINMDSVYNNIYREGVERASEKRKEDLDIDTYKRKKELDLEFAQKRAPFDLSIYEKKLAIEKKFQDQPQNPKTLLNKADEIIKTIEEYNKAMDKKGTPHLKIGQEEMKRSIESLLKIPTSKDTAYKLEQECMRMFNATFNKQGPVYDPKTKQWKYNAGTWDENTFKKYLEFRENWQKMYDVKLPPLNEQMVTNMEFFPNMSSTEAESFFNDDNE